MNTQEVAITIPKELVAMVDDISKKRGLSRSKFISTIVVSCVKYRIRDSSFPRRLSST